MFVPVNHRYIHFAPSPFLLPPPPREVCASHSPFFFLLNLAVSFIKFICPPPTSILPRFFLYVLPLVSTHPPLVISPLPACTAPLFLALFFRFSFPSSSFSLFFMSLLNLFAPSPSFFSYPLPSFLFSFIFILPLICIHTSHLSLPFPPLLVLFSFSLSSSSSSSSFFFFFFFFFFPSFPFHSFLFTYPIHLSLPLFYCSSLLPLLLLSFLSFPLISIHIPHSSLTSPLLLLLSSSSSSSSSFIHSFTKCICPIFVFLSLFPSFLPSFLSFVFPLISSQPLIALSSSFFPCFSFLFLSFSFPFSLFSSFSLDFIPFGISLSPTNRFFFHSKMTLLRYKVRSTKYPVRFELRNNCLFSLACYPLLLLLVKYYYYCSSGFYIKYPTKVDMPLNKETETKYITMHLKKRRICLAQGR